jgi:hypothetical protein
LKAEKTIMKSLLRALLMLAAMALPAWSAVQSSVSQYGITWTFDKECEVGNFVTGDWYVVGPVIIQSITPSPTGTRNGSVVNPVGGSQGYDSRGGNWVASKQAVLPLAFQPGQSLVSAISNPDIKNCTGGVGGWTNYKGDCSRGIMETQAVLTCLASAPAELSFRPPYAGATYKPVHPLSAVKWTVLPKLPSPASIPNANTILRQFQRPWIDHQNGWTLQYTHSMNNHPGYGRDMANQVSNAALYVLLDEPKVDSVAIRLIQLGIDNHGVTKAGGYWGPDGGHALGRKWPILFAGLMLDDDSLTSIGARSGAYLYTDGYGPQKAPPGYIRFGEDDQTFYVSRHPDAAGAWAAGTDERYDIYVPDSNGNYRKREKNGFVWYGHGDPTKLRDFQEYLDTHEGMPEWGIRHSTEPNRDGRDWDAPYRSGTNGDPYEGFILSAHILGLKQAWNHNALFDYVDRFVSINGVPSSFVGNMWKMYRADYGCIWRRTDPLDRYSNGAPDCSACRYNCGNTHTPTAGNGTGSRRYEAPKARFSTVTLHDLRGRKVHADATKALSAVNRIGMPAIRNGLYLVRLEQDANSAIVRMPVVR